MVRALYEKISDWFDAHGEEMVNDISRLVRIGSVSNPEAEEKPFGAECRRCLEEMLKTGKSMDSIRKITNTMWEVSERRRKTGII